ncbi:MAG: type III-B CRISPR module RAMP protein Cmr4, partial [Thermoflexales bacterium]|nr:type III-B CRISPR module RAMP protein Cmr4 [Thermoflexales bacterium]
MFEKSALLFIYVEMPLHAGTGRGLGAVDLPIQRERVTQYPMIQASSLKGKLRAEVRLRNAWQDDSAEIVALFGKAGEAGDSFSGAVAPGDARVLLFPVRSLAGVLAWTTSLHVLQRFARDCAFAGINPPALPSSPPALGEAFVTSDALKAGDRVVLEDFSFTPRTEHKETLKKLADWIAARALPNTHAYWREQIAEKFVLLPEDAF